MSEPASAGAAATAVAPRLRAVLAGMPAYTAGAPVTGPDGTPGYRLSLNENPHPPLPSVLEAVAGAAARLNRYPDLTCSDLTAAIAASTGVDAERVVVGAGSSALIVQAMQAACEAGDEVVFAWRSFDVYPVTAAVVGATPVPVPLAPGGRHDVDAMAAAVTERTRVVMVCSPNNPTGTVVSAGELERLLEAVPREVLVVVDEAYAEYVRDPLAADGLAAARHHENVVVLRTFSKAYGLAGLRVGYAVASPQVARVLRSAGAPFGVSGVAQVAAVASLAAEEELMARVGASVAERERVVAALAAQGWRLPRSEANFVWLPLGERTPEFVAAAADRGISVRPFGLEGARVTVAEVEGDDRFLEVAAAFAPGG